MAVLEVPILVAISLMVTYSIPLEEIIFLIISTICCLLIVVRRLICIVSPLIEIEKFTEEGKYMKRNSMVFVSLAILIAIIFFTSNLPVKNKQVDIQSQLAVTHGAHKFEEPCIQSFEAADLERTGEHALGPFLESILLQKSSHTIFGSTVTYTAENIHGVIGLVYL